MNKSDLTFSIPELDLRSVVILRNFLESFLFELDTHYHDELQDYFCALHQGEEISY